MVCLFVHLDKFSRPARNISIDGEVVLPLGGDEERNIFHFLKPKFQRDWL